MSEAPESVVRAVQEALGCWRRGGTYHYCGEHGGDAWVVDRGCPVAVQAADAAWVASLNAAAERLGEASPAWTYIAAAELRRWADESEQVTVTYCRWCHKTHALAPGESTCDQTDESEAAK